LRGTQVPIQITRKERVWTQGKVEGGGENRKAATPWDPFELPTRQGGRRENHHQWKTGGQALKETKKEENRGERGLKGKGGAKGKPNERRRCWDKSKPEVVW